MNDQALTKVSVTPSAGSSRALLPVVETRDRPGAWGEPWAGPTVAEALAAFEALCLKCLVTQTGYRFENVLRELEALRVDLVERRCAVCGDDWPVFPTPGGASAALLRP